MGYDEFKGKFINDILRFPNTKGIIPLFKSALDSAVKTELPSRDGHESFIIRDITNSKGLSINHSSTNLMIKYSYTKKCLLVGTLSPAWRRGWRSISKDSFVNNQIDSFFHLASQYVYRSYQINIIGAIALTYGRSCDFRGNEYRAIELPYSNIEYTKFRDSISITQNKRNRIFNQYLGLINSLDPFVNRVIFYYARSLSLRYDDYDEESITAADNAVDVIIQAIKQRKGLPTMDRKDMYHIINQEIHLPNAVIDRLDDLYQLRCRFSSHPAQSKWWDFYEIYEQDIEAIMDSVKSAVIKFLIYEMNDRRIENSPACWSEWFLEHCETIYDAVWFDKFDLPP